MIDKLQPRKLDKDTDQKLVQKTSMTDALNIYVDESAAGSNGNSGVIKPILGTKALEFLDGTEILSEDVRVLGSTTDDLTGILYFYVWTSKANEMGVYAYDKRGLILPNPGLLKVFTHPTFNFPPDGFVKGDVVHKRKSQDIQSLSDVDCLLYFTDNTNEPRKLDVYKAIFSEMPNNNYKVHDIICACPKVPMGNVDYIFEADINKQVSNFENSPGVQFALQGVYPDGTVTSIGPYSQIAFPPTLVNRGAAAAANMINHNVCKIKVPPFEENYEYIKILFRYGNKPSFRELAEVPNSGASNDENWDPETRQYSFYDDQVAKGVSPSDVAKTFDNLPRRARAQAAVGNRLVFSNFADGFDPYKPEVTTTVLFKKRPAEGIDFTIDIVPTIEKTDIYSGSSSTQYLVRNKVMGFEIDTDQIPNAIPQGTTISINFSFSPDKNFHVFEARGAYQQSQHVGPVSGNFKGMPNKWTHEEEEVLVGRGDKLSVVEDVTAFVELNDSDYHLTDFVENNQEASDLFVGEGTSARMLLKDKFGSEGWESALGSGQGSSLYSDGNAYGGNVLRGLKYDATPNVGGLVAQPNVNAFFGRNFGVGYRLDQNASSEYLYPYRATDGNRFEPCPGYAYKTNGNEYKQSIAAYGTSAGAPLILQGGSLTFGLTFTITEDVSNGRVLVAQTIEDVMVRRPLQFSSSVTVSSVENDFTHSIDVGLLHGKKIYQSDPEKNLICAAANVGRNTVDGDGVIDPQMDPNNLLQLNQADPATGQRRIPMHYFIVNKADVRFFFEPSLRPIAHRKSFQLAIADVSIDEDEGLFTCIKRPEPDTPWYCISKSEIDKMLDGWSTYNEVVSEYTMGINEDQKFLRLGYPANDGISMSVEALEVTDNIWAINDKVVGRIKCRETDGMSFPKFWPCSIDIDSEDYVPGANYRFSLLDGAGGPGGTPPGANSAYAKFENNRFGSIAGQMIATLYGVHNSTPRGRLLNMVSSMAYDGDNARKFPNTTAEGVRDVGLIGGVYKKDGTAVSQGDQGYSFAGGVKTNMTPDVSNSGVPSQASVYDYAEGLGIAGIGQGANFQPTEDVTNIVYMLTGPFFTGSIAMNPIALDAQVEGGYVDMYDNDNESPLYDEFGGSSPLSGYEFLCGNTCPLNKDQRWLPAMSYDQTTTMPYIFSGSTAPRVYENQFAYNTVFPFPLLDEVGESETDGPAVVGYSVYDQVNAPLYSDLYDQGSDLSSIGFHASHPTFGGISWADRPGHAEMGTVATSVTGTTGKPIMSFKSNANHEFGIIYYDERGRHGRVNHLTSVYVPGYSPAERNGITDGGPVHLRMRFLSDPPEWARYYKIAYSKNTSISKFFQYTAGGAFITPGDNPVDSGLSSAKIYVSLNYLQGHPISYSDSWGARSQDGSPVVYQPKEGDKVRVISYQRASDSVTEKVFPKNIVFDVIGVESLGDSDNPLWNEDGVDIPANRKGLFLTIKNNPDNERFSYADIEQENHAWGNNCIIEIFRPVDDLGAEDRLYYEIGPTYRCGWPVANSGGSQIISHKHLNHNGQDAAIEIVDGDVFFRKTAVNMREFNGGEFVDLIRTEGVDADDDGTFDDWVVTAEPNFKSIYTESMSASDLFKSDAVSIGRPNKIDNDEKQVRRIASVIHSDSDISKDSRVGYSSFNGSESNDKDLDISHGQVDYIANTDDSLLVIQANKVSHIPVNRNLISTADNEPSLISSSQFINTPRYYAGRAGTDGHPESVAMINNNAFFAHKGDGKVFRASGANGVMDISEKGMKSFFRNLLTTLGKYDKIIGGYDPVKEEYLITTKSISELTDRNGVFISAGMVPDLTFNTNFLQNATQSGSASATAFLDDQIVINDPDLNTGEDQGGVGLGGG